MPDKAPPEEVIISEEQQPVPVNVVVGAPRTAEQQDKQAERDDLRQEATELGQRSINLIWETTQSRIAQLVVVVGVLLNAVVVILVIFYNREVSTTQLALISICLQFINLTVGIVIGFYFSRTNHQNRGGVGNKPDNPYTGR